MRWDILISLDSRLIYRYVSESFEMRQEQVENMTDKTNVSFTLLFSSQLVLSWRECKPGITVASWYTLRRNQQLIFKMMVPSVAVAGVASSCEWGSGAPVAKLSSHEAARGRKWSIKENFWPKIEILFYEAAEGGIVLEPKFIHENIYWKTKFKIRNWSFTFIVTFEKIDNILRTCRLLTFDLHPLADVPGMLLNFMGDVVIAARHPQKYNILTGCRWPIAIQKKVNKFWCGWEWLLVGLRNALVDLQI